MTVEEFLNHFTYYSDSLIFFDKTNNVKNTIYFSHSPISKDSEKEAEFLGEYGEYDVVSWEVSTEYIYIEIEKR